MKDPGGFPGIFHLLVHKLGASWVKCETGPCQGRQGGMEERDRPLQMAGGGFEKQWNLHSGLVLGGCRMRKSQHPATRTFKVSVEAFNGAHSHPHPDSLNTTSLCQRSILKNSSTVGSVHSGGGLSAQGRGWEPSACLGAARMSTSCHLLQQLVRKTQCQFYTEQSKGSNIFKISLTLHYDEWKNRVVILEYFLVTKTTHLQTFCSTFFLTVHL